MIDRCADAEDTSYIDRSDEVDPIDSARDHTAYRSRGVGDPACQIHWHHHPSTKEAATRIDVLRHCNGAQRDLAAGIWIFIH
jgi:hypothetical protein